MTARIVMLTMLLVIVEGRLAMILVSDGDGMVLLILFGEIVMMEIDGRFNVVVD
jgi:hypothetical protein